MDPQSIVDTYHTVDPASGMTMTKGNYAEAFTPERKEQFLSVYQANGLRFLSTCKQLGLSDHTINHHVAIDPAFKARLAQVQAEYAEELEARQRNYALEPKQFMDRAMQLRALLPGKYAREQNYGNVAPIQININGNLMIDAKSREDFIEARVKKEIENGSASFGDNDVGNSSANNNTVDDHR